MVLTIIIYIFIINFTTSGLTTATQCINNPFAQALNISVNQNPSKGTDIKFCQYLSIEGNCCSSSVIEQISTDITKTRKQLEEKVSQRDKIIAPLFNIVNDNLNQLLRVYRKIANLSVMRELNGSHKGIINIENFLDDFNNELISIQSEFENYQKERKKCFEEVLDIRASSYCMACDPNWQTKGIETDGSINFSKEAKLRFSRSCYSFAIKSTIISKIIFIEKYTKIMVQNAHKLYEFLKGFDEYFISKNRDPAAWVNFFRQNNNEFGLTGNNLITSFNIDMSIIKDSSLTVSDMLQKGVRVPSNCNSDIDCEYFATHFMKHGGLLDYDALLLGGEPIDTIKMIYKTGQRFGNNNNNKRLLRVTERGSFERNLATTGTWNPQKNESGLWIIVNADPANQAHVTKIKKSTTILFPIITILIILQLMILTF